MQKAKLRNGKVFATFVQNSIGDMEQNKRTQIAELGEFGLIDTLTQGFKTQVKTTLRGVGDDAAVIAAGRRGDAFEFTLEGGESVTSKAVVIATGISRRKLGIPGEKELFGKGVSYCAVCDCNFYRGRRAVIVGNDSEAAVSAEMMTGFASETSWVVWDLQASDVLFDKAVAAGVRILRSKPKAILGESAVEALELEDGTVVPTDGVFIELGARSAADIAMDLDVMPEMDDTIKVDAGCATGVPGVFACGDVTGRPWQVAKAVGQGCVAGMNAAAYARGER